MNKTGYKKYLERGMLASVAFVALGLVASSIVNAALPLTDANISNPYIVTSMPMRMSPQCPLIGGIVFLPGGVLRGTFITDTARSLFKNFRGTYALTAGGNIKFTANNSVPLSNLNGVIARAAPGPDVRHPPVEYLVLTTAAGSVCSNQVYKLALTEEEAE
jgi:hypothetical protein